MPRGLRKTSSKERKRIRRSVIRRHGLAVPRGQRAAFVVDETAYRVLCFHCDEELSPKTFTLDHVLPVALGGDNTVSNFVPSCGPCNQKRGCNEPEGRLLLVQQAS